MLRPSAPSRGRWLAQIATALVIGAGAAGLTGACTDDFEVPVTGTDAGEDTGSVERVACPQAEPTNGSMCLLPEGTTCDFGVCGTRLAVCTRGAWKLGSNAKPSPPCPGPAPPDTNSACPPCWPAGKSCPYGSAPKDCSQEDASINTAMASCQNEKWVLDIRPCRDGGGPDVQGDSGADAD